MSTTIVLSIIAFTIVILALVMILLVAQSKLVQTGDVNIVINGDESEPLVASAGTSLLNTLGGNKIFLPSACGGGEKRARFKTNY
jgi:Na+-transporting NADH:ubiquinone oxidoreductase subunit F